VGKFLFDVITVGSNTIDAFVKTKANLINYHCKGEAKDQSECLAYPVGEKILIEHLDFQVGGGGTNTAVAFSRLGLKTAYLGKIGNDDNGVKVFRNLKDEKVEFIGSLGTTTGFSVILDSIEEDRTVLTHKGCNDDLDFKEIDLDKIYSKWIYFSSMRKKILKTQKRLAELASERGIKLAFNPSSYLARLGPKPIKKILDNTNVIICNKEEAQLLTNSKTNSRSVKVVAKKMKDLVKDVAIITDGKNGAVCFDGITLIEAKPKRNLKILETTGAGDAFASGFVAGLIEKKELKTCMRMGFIEAEQVIVSYGAKNDLAGKVQMKSLLKKDRRKIIETKIKRRKR